MNKYFASRLDGNTCFLTKEITIKKRYLFKKSAEKGNETSALLMEVESFLCYREPSCCNLPEYKPRKAYSKALISYIRNMPETNDLILCFIVEIGAQILEDLILEGAECFWGIAGTLPAQYIQQQTCSFLTRVGFPHAGLFSLVIGMFKLA